MRASGSLKLGKLQASVLVRSLLKSERPSGLTQAIIEVGRINKTLYLLNYIDDEDYRRRILTCQYRSNSDPPCQSKTDPPPLNYSIAAALVFFWS